MHINKIAHLERKKKRLTKAGQTRSLKKAPFFLMDHRQKISKRQRPFFKIEN